jgi:hypothetical protein
LIWLAEVWPPDQQKRVFKPENFGRLTSRLLTRKFRVETEKDRKEREERQYMLAGMFMEKGVIKCMEKVDAPYEERVQREAYSLILTLKKAAISPGEGIDFGAYA